MTLKWHINDSEHVPYHIASEFMMQANYYYTWWEKSLSECWCNCRKLPAHIIQVAAIAMKDLLEETFTQDIIDIFNINPWNPVQSQLSRLNICSPPLTEGSDKTEVWCIQWYSRWEKCSTRTEDNIKKAFQLKDGFSKTEIDVMKSLLRDLIINAVWAQWIRWFETFQK